tara:strand:+ start:293 stop:796 length:504 start_codon:yes stop_codon:yes gene_type:complete
MSNFTSTSNFVANQAIADTSTTQLLPLGTRVQAVDSAATAYGVGEFIYLQGVASTVVGSVVTFDFTDHSTALLVANAVGSVATAMSNCVASEYGWYQIYGKAVGKGLASLADNANIYGTATAGSVDDAIVAGDRVQNAATVSALDTPSTGLVELGICYPFVNNALAD